MACMMAHVAARAVCAERATPAGARCAHRSRAGSEHLPIYPDARRGAIGEVTAFCDTDRMLVAEEGLQDGPGRESLSGSRMLPWTHRTTNAPFLGDLHAVC